MILGLLLAALVSWKPRKTTSSTKPLNSLVHRPCRMSHRRLCILMRCNQGVEPCNALLHNAILSFLSVLSFLSHRVSHTPTASRRVAPRHTGHRVTRTPRRVRPPGSGLRARGRGAGKLCLPHENNGQGFEARHLLPFHITHTSTAGVQRRANQRAYPLLKRRSQACPMGGLAYVSGVYPRRHSVVPAAPGEAHAGMRQAVPLPRAGSGLPNRRIGPPGATGKPVSRQTRRAPPTRQLCTGRLSGWHAHSRGTSGEGKTRNPFHNSY